MYIQNRHIEKNGTIPEFLFRNCFLEEIILPKKLKRIGYGAFEYSSIKRIVIPKTVCVIDHYAFNNCYNLSEVIIEGDLDYLGSHAFTYCTNLKRITFNTINCVGTQASPIHDCDNLEEIVFNDKTEFPGSSSENQNIPTKGLNNVFVCNCPNLQKITFKKECIVSPKYKIYENCPKIKSTTYKATQNKPTEYIIY